MNPEQKEMRKIAEIEPHNRYMQIRLTEAEYEAIERKFRNSGLRSRSEFIRTMIFEGYIVNFDEEKFDKIYRLVGSIANNINQIFNNVSRANGRTFETNMNQGKVKERAWKKLIDLSDEVCKRHHLSVIDHPERTKGKSHWEWDMNRQWLSWKPESQGHYQMLRRSQGVGRP